MGTLSYGSWTVEFDDRLLTHLQIVIVNKFRRSEPFLISWLDSNAVGGGRSAIWLTPNAPAYFKFNGSRTATVDETWLRKLNVSAGTSTGLVVVDQDGTPVRAGGDLSTHHVPRATRSRLDSS